LVDDRLPLVILDGMRLDAASALLGGTSRLEDINPDDIESIEVLSPAQAVRYGPNAANGVLILRTRDPRRGALRWRGYAQAGIAVPSDRWPTRVGGFDAGNPDSLLRNGGCTLLTVAAGSCIQDSVAALPSPLGKQLRTVLRQQYGLSVTGGGDRLSFYVGGEWDGDGSPLSLSQQEINRLESIGQTVSNSVRYPQHFGGGNVTANIRLRPASSVNIDLHGLHASEDIRAPAFLSNLAAGSGVEFQSGYIALPDAFRVQDVNDLSRWLGSVDVSWTPMRALTLTGLLGHDGSRLHGNRQGGANFLVESVVLNSEDLGLGADYDWRISGLLLRSHVGWEGSRINRDSLECRSLTSPGCTGAYQSFEQRYDQRFSSVVLEQHVWPHKALELVGTVRRDHFTEYQAYHQTATHPAVHAAWWHGQLHLRADYGSAGRRPFIFAKPERTKEMSAGVDFSTGSGRVTVGGTIYDMRSSVFAPPLIISGPPINFTGTIGNRGIELYATARLIERPDVALQAEASAWGNRNRLLSMNPPVGIFLPGVLKQRSYVGYPVAGFWANRPPSYADANGNGIIERNEIGGPADEIWAGTPYPTQGATLASELTLRTLRIGTSLDYQAGHVIFNRNHWYTCVDGQCPWAVDRTTPLAVQADIASGMPTPRYFEKGDFVAWRELWVTFDAPPSIATALHVKAASITLAGRNLHIWTGYSGISPEPYATETQFGQGEASTEPLMPALKQWSLRVRISY
jgi:outer membrane receptor protein involved in Fe transport